MSDFIKSLFGRHKKPLSGRISDPRDSGQDERISHITVLAEGLAGGWPPQLPRDAFRSVDLEKLVAQLQFYIGKGYKDLQTDQFPAKPEYEVVNGKVGRVANPVQDVKIVQTARMLKGNKVRAQDTKQMLEQYGRLAFKVIEYYAQTKLARLLFLLPTALRSHQAIASGRRAIIVDEQLRIDVYKGVENVLLEIWDELPEAGHIDDSAVNEKLLSIVRSQQQRALAVVVNDGSKDLGQKRKVCINCNSELSTNSLQCPKCGSSRFMWE